MGEHKIPKPSHPGAPAPDEAFWLHDEATGKDFSIREATTELLERHAKNVTLLHVKTTKESLQQISLMISQHIGRLVQLAAMKAVIDFELDRRKRKGGLVDVLGGTLQ